MAAIAALIGCALLTAAAGPSDNPSSDDAVGTIEGDSIALTGPMSVEVVGGQVKTMLRSGNDIRVKSGQARLDLVEGGQIAICGPAHLSVLKSAGALTLALDTGVIHARIERKPVLTIYTAQIQARPIAIGDGPQDALIGFETPGAMCVKATVGAIRLEQQLTAQNVIVPQGGDVLVNNGRLDGLQNTQGHCSCEAAISKATPKTPEFSRLATPEEIEKKQTPEKKEVSKREDIFLEKPAKPKPSRTVRTCFSGRSTSTTTGCDGRSTSGSCITCRPKRRAASRPAPAPSATITRWRTRRSSRSSPRTRIERARTSP